MEKPWDRFNLLTLASLEFDRKRSRGLWLSSIRRDIDSQLVSFHTSGEVPKTYIQVCGPATVRRVGYLLSSMSKAPGCFPCKFSRVILCITTALGKRLPLRLMQKVHRDQWASSEVAFQLWPLFPILSLSWHTFLKKNKPCKNEFKTNQRVNLERTIHSVNEYNESVELFFNISCIFPENVINCQIDAKENAD